MPARPAKGGVYLSVRATPRARRAAVTGLVCDDAGKHWLAASVTAAPDDGAANAALHRLIAAWIGCPRSAVALHGGAVARSKTFLITGAEAVKALEQRLAELKDPT